MSLRLSDIIYNFTHNRDIFDTSPRPQPKPQQPMEQVMPEPQSDERESRPIYVSGIKKLTKELDEAADAVNAAEDFLRKLEVAREWGRHNTEIFMIHLMFKNVGGMEKEIDPWICGRNSEEQEEWGNPMLYHLTRFAEAYAVECRHALLLKKEELKSHNV